MTLAIYTPDVTADLLAEGFTEGPPAHLSAEVLMADLDSYSRAGCEHCGKRRQRVLPFHRGEDYALVTVCRSCGHTSEM